MPRGDGEYSRRAYPGRDGDTELEHRAIAQLASRREDVGARQDARAGLVDMLRALHRTPRVIQAEKPDFAHSFRLPGRSAHGVLTAARLAARDLPAVARLFIEYGLPENRKAI